MFPCALITSPVDMDPDSMSMALAIVPPSLVCQTIKPSFPPIPVLLAFPPAPDVCVEAFPVQSPPVSDPFSGPIWLASQAKASVFARPWLMRKPRLDVHPVRVEVRRTLQSVRHIHPHTEASLNNPIHNNPVMTSTHITLSITSNATVEEP